MRDSVYRQDAIDALEGKIKLKDSDDVDNVARYIQQVALKINELPSAEKKAKILNANPVGECSACGWLIDYRDGFNYCPGCGARLEEDNG